MAARWVIAVALIGVLVEPRRVKAGPSQSAPLAVRAEIGSHETTPPSSLGPPVRLARLPPVADDGEKRATKQETLAEVWAAALAFDQALAAKRSESLSAHQYLGVARAQRWPTAGVESTYQVRSARPAFSSKFLGVPVPTDVFPYAQRESLALRTSVELPLYTSGRISREIDAAAAEVNTSHLEVVKGELDLRRATAGEYVNVLHAQRDLQIAESSVKRLESHARDVELLFEHGRVPQNDRLAANVALANARQEGIRAANRLDLARAAFNRRAGRPLDAPVAIAELPETPAPPDLEQLTALALQKRPELAILAARARAARYRAEAARAAGRPDVSLQGEYAFEENRYRSPDGIAAVGVGVRWNVLDGGRRSHEASALQWEAESLRRAQADAVSIVQLEVRQAWLDVNQTRRRLDVTRQALAQAEENLRVATNRYRAGLAISTEVLDAESLRTQAYGNHCQATYDAALAWLELQYATGQLGR